jgi:hypothetical protein
MIQRCARSGIEPETLFMNVHMCYLPASLLLPHSSELQMGSKVIVQMQGAKTTLLDPTGAVAPKDFTFDFSYWSFDSSSPQFATNPKVYSDLGVSVLNNAWSGYNCCVSDGRVHDDCEVHEHEQSGDSPFVARSVLAPGSAVCLWPDGVRQILFHGGLRGG